MDGRYRKSPPHFGNPVTPVCERRPLKKVEQTLVGWGWTGRGGWPPGRIKRGSAGSLPTGDQRALMSQMFVHALSITPPSSSDASKEDSVWVCWGGGGTLMFPSSGDQRYRPAFKAAAVMEEPIFSRCICRFFGSSIFMLVIPPPPTIPGGYDSSFSAIGSSAYGCRPITGEEKKNVLKINVGCK